jgi:hypothetical protein
MLSCGNKCYHVGTNIIMWDKCNHLGPSGISGNICYHVGANVIMWEHMLSCGNKCYHVGQM